MPFICLRLIRWHACGCLLVLAGIASACGCGDSHDPQEVASLYLTCVPVSRGVHCRLLALSRDVSHSPRDVTPNALWRLSGIAGAQMSVNGTIDAPGDGDLWIDAEYASHRVQAQVRLAHDRPGQMLAALRGRVYADKDGTLRPIVHARVEVIGGPSAGLSTTTLDDGSYEFVGVVPGEIAIQATKIGYTAAEGSTQLRSGDNRLSLVIETQPLQLDRVDGEEIDREQAVSVRASWVVLRKTEHQFLESHVALAGGQRDARMSTASPPSADAIGVASPKMKDRHERQL